VLTGSIGPWAVLVKHGCGSLTGHPRAVAGMTAMGAITVSHDVAFPGVLCRPVSEAAVGGHARHGPVRGPAEEEVCVSGGAAMADRGLDKGYPGKGQSRFLGASLKPDARTRGRAAQEGTFQAVVVLAAVAPVHPGPLGEPLAIDGEAPVHLPRDRVHNSPMPASTSLTGANAKSLSRRANFALAPGMPVYVLKRARGCMPATLGVSGSISQGCR